MYKNENKGITLGFQFPHRWPIKMFAQSNIQYPILTISQQDRVGLHFVSRTPQSDEKLHSAQNSDNTTKCEAQSAFRIAAIDLKRLFGKLSIQIY